MRIGIENMPVGTVPTFDRHLSGLEALVRQVVQVEEEGFDSFWSIQSATGEYDALTVLAIAGRETHRIEIGTDIVPTFLKHPLSMAQQALTAQVAVGGRLTLGLGISHSSVVEGAIGLSYDRPARHMREYVSVLRPLINHGRVDFRGDVFNIRTELNVPNAPAMRSIIAALAPMMLRIAGGLADGTVTWMAGIRAVDTHIVPRVRAAAEDAGRPPPRVCVSLPIAVTDDEAGLREAAAIQYQSYAHLSNYRTILDIEGVESPADVAVIGSESQVERQLRAFADAGSTDFIASVFPVGGDPAESVARTRGLLQGLVGKI